MKHLLITTIAAVVFVGCGESQQSAPAPETKPVEPVAEVPSQQSAPAPEAKPVEPVIWEAIKEGNLEAVKQHFNSGIDVNIKVSKEGRSSQSWHPLNWAAANGQIEIVEFLLSRGAEVNSKDGVGYIALHYAAGRGSYREVVEVLIANGEDVNTKAVDGSTPLDLAAMNQQKEIMDLIRKHSGKHGTFFGAVSGGDIEAVKKFLVAGVDTNKKSGRATPLMAAAASGHNETVELLISEGAEINVIMRDAIIDRNLTAVDIAEQKGNKDTAELLRKHGAKTAEELKAEGK